MRLFCFDVQNTFRFRSGKFSQIEVKTQKSTNNRISRFGLIEKNMELSHIYLAVDAKNLNETRVNKLDLLTPHDLYTVLLSLLYC